MAHQVIFEKSEGTLKGSLPVVMQGSTLETITILALYRDGTAVDMSTKDVTATATGADGSVYDISGALTGANGSFTWKFSAGDVGTPDAYTMLFAYSDGSETWESDPVRFVVRPSASATAVQNAAIVGVPTADALWLATSALGGALGTAAYQSADAFEPFGAAADAKAIAIQRANHTGTQLASTISDFAANVRSTVLTGLSLATSTAITAADTVLSALGKLQAQITTHANLTNTAHGGILPEDAGIVAVSAGRDLASTDAGKILECNGTFTLNAPNGLDAGFQCALNNIGVGIITISASTTLTAKGAAYTLANQYGMATIYHAGSNIWRLAGDLT